MLIQQERWINDETNPVSILHKIYSGPLSARQGSWRADNRPL